MAERSPKVTITVATKDKIDIDTVISLLIEGDTYRQIATKFKVKLSTLHDYLSKSEHSARVREALQISADSYADKAEQVLLDIKKTSNQTEFWKARELAQHYRWKAAKRAPKNYGEKIQQEHSGEIKQPLDLSKLTDAELDHIDQLLSKGEHKG